MNEEYIVFKRRADGTTVYVKERGMLTDNLNQAERYAYHSEAKAIALTYAMHVREV